MNSQINKIFWRNKMRNIMKSKEERENLIKQRANRTLDEN
jgi:hypothetical protein